MKTPLKVGDECYVIVPLVSNDDTRYHMFNHLDRVTITKDHGVRVECKNKRGFIQMLEPKHLLKIADLTQEEKDLIESELALMEAKKSVGTPFKGMLKDFPVEVVEKMLEHQIEQDNKHDVSVFEKDIYAGKPNGGFTWGLSSEKDTFWHTVLVKKEFDVFFERYPKASPKVEILPPITNIVDKLTEVVQLSYSDKPVAVCDGKKSKLLDNSTYGLLTNDFKLDYKEGNLMAFHNASVISYVEHKRKRILLL